MPLIVNPLSEDQTQEDALTAEDLAQIIVGRGIPVSNASFTGSNLAAGTFADDLDPENPESVVLREGFTTLDLTPVNTIVDDVQVQERVGGELLFTVEEEFVRTDEFLDGVVLSTGEINGITNSNTFRTLESTDFGLEGDALLEEQISPGPTQDAFVLEFDFVPDLTTLLFRFIFASEEYTDFDNRQFNDAFGFFLTGPSQDGTGFNNENIATITDPSDNTELSVSVNSLLNTLVDPTIEEPLNPFPDSELPFDDRNPIELDNTLADRFDTGDPIVTDIIPTNDPENSDNGGANEISGLLASNAFARGVNDFDLLDADNPLLLLNDLYFFDPDVDPDEQSFPFPDLENQNREFLLDNPLINSSDSVHEFEFNQFTTILDAIAEGIVPNQTYSARIVIADNFDGIVDSAVFIEDQNQTRLRREQGQFGTDLTIDLDQVVAVDDSVNIGVNQSVTIDVLDNDVDPQRDPLDILTPPPELLEFNTLTTEGGTVVRDDNGTPEDLRDDQLVYTPQEGFSGTDTFQYTIRDVVDLSNGVQSTDTAEVTIGVFEEVPATLETDDSIFFISGDDNLPNQSSFQLSMELQGRSAAFVNEVGVVKVDSQNRINGVSPEDPGYLREAIEESQVVFSALTQRVIVDVNSTRQLDFFSGDRLLFFLVQDESIDTVRERLDAGAANVPNVFFATPEANDGDDQLEIEQNGDVFTLRWEDLKASDEESDNDFNDLTMTLQLTENPDLVGTGLQGEVELLDLRGLNDIEAQFLVQDDAAFGNTVGFYEVDNPEGTITTVDDSGTNFITLNPGDNGYAEAAIENTVVSFGRDGTDDVELEGLLAPYIIANATPEEFLGENPRNLRGRNPLAFFPYFEANPDGGDHIRLLSDNTFGFEDLPDGISDFDFEDMVVELQFS